MYQLRFKDGKTMNVGTIYGIGCNYSEHIAEMQECIPDEPIVFIKPASAYISSGQNIILPKISNNVHYELELVVVISKECRNIKKESAINYIAGYGVGLDITMRDVQKKAKDTGNPWAVCKGFAYSAPISDIITITNDNLSIPTFDLLLKVNGETKQQCNTSMMIHKIDYLIEFLSSIFILQAGDCIFTGTPSGVGEIVAGDNLHAELVNFSCLDIAVVSE